MQCNVEGIPLCAEDETRSFGRDGKGICLLNGRAVGLHFVDLLLMLLLTTARGDGESVPGRRLRLWAYERGRIWG